MVNQLESVMKKPLTFMQISRILIVTMVLHLSRDQVNRKSIVQL